MKHGEIDELSHKLSVPLVRPKVDRGVPATHDSSDNLLKGVLRDPSPISPESTAVKKITNANLHRLSHDKLNMTVQSMN